MIDQRIKSMFPNIEAAMDNPNVRRFAELAGKYLAVQTELGKALNSCQNDGFYPGPVDSLRFRLPTTREGTTNEVTLSCEDEKLQMFIRSATFNDGRLGEVFINVERQGSFVSGMIDAFSIVLSLALQYGVPLQRVVDKLENTRFGKIGVLSPSSIKRPTSMIDYVAKWLKQTYLKSETEGETHAG
jgi:hypothetical protein